MRVRPIFLFLFWYLNPEYEGKNRIPHQEPYCALSLPQSKEEPCLARTVPQTKETDKEPRGRICDEGFLFLGLNPNFENKISLRPSKNCFCPLSAQHWCRAYYQYYILTKPSKSAQIPAYMQDRVNVSHQLAGLAKRRQTCQCFANVANVFPKSLQKP